VNLEISAEAERMISGYLFWLEERNTSGAGLRFYQVLENRLKKLAGSFPVFPPCQNLVLKKRLLHCIKWRQWILAFEVLSDKIVLRAFLHKAYLPA
jgi:hypothetical protein